VSPYAETAESILEHAESMTRLDRHLSARQWAAQLGDHERAIRVLAAPHVAPAVDLAFLRALKAASAGVQGAFVHLQAGAIELLVDTPRGQRALILGAPRERSDGDD
jgi:hypothetical protein